MTNSQILNRVFRLNPDSPPWNSHSQHDIANELVLVHSHMSNRHTKAKHVLQLKLDSRLDVDNLLVEVISIVDRPSRDVEGCFVLVC